MTTSTAEKRYSYLSRKRASYLRRAQACAALTIPSLIPINSDRNDDSDFETPYQSIAARGVNNLASKLMLALLPTNAPFFKLCVDTEEMKKKGEVEELDGEMKVELERGLAKVERAVIEEIAGTSDRVVLFEALKHLIVGGNALLFVDPEGGMKCYHLHNYVVRRDGRGEPMEIILKEYVSEFDIPERTLIELRSKCGEEQGQQSESRGKEEEEHVLYTHLIREQERWTIRQEIKGITVDGSEGTYPLDAMPWIPMRLLSVSGSDYGRSYVEEYYGDIVSLDGLSKALLEGTAAAARVIFLLSPNSTTRETDIAEAPNLGIVIGNKADIEALQVNKYADFRVARETCLGIEQRLEHAFILNSVIQRNAERVTAEEIRQMIEDLETALGGVYSLLAIEFQLPYITCRLKQFSKKGRIPQLPKSLVKPIIITGVEALGRGNDLEKLNTMITIMTKTLGEGALQYINTQTLITRLCTSLGIDTDGLVLTEDEVSESRNQMQTQQSMNAIAPNMVNAAGQFLKANPEMLSGAMMPMMQQQQQQEQ